MLGVFLDAGTIDRGDLDPGVLRAALPEWNIYAETGPADIVSRIAAADVVVSNKVRLGKEALQAAPHLKLVCIAATGTNNIDLEAAGNLHITVCNARAYATASVLEHVFALILALSRRLNDYREAIQQGRWQKASGFCLLDYPIRELSGRTLGIIGYGELGRAVARLGNAFGMNLMIAQRPGAPQSPGRTSLDRLLSDSDIVSLHCPLTDATRGLIGAAQLRLMRCDALLINTARGGIVDEEALLEALQSGWIAGAGVDVLSAEPPLDGNPLLDVTLPNLIVTPHIAWAGIGARQALLNELAENIRAYLEGVPRNVVTPQT